MSQSSQRDDFMCKQLASKFSTSNLFNESIGYKPETRPEGLPGVRYSAFCQLCINRSKMNETQFE